MPQRFFISVSELQTALASLPKADKLPKDYQAEVALGPFLFKFDYSDVDREWEIYDMVKIGRTIND
jgi:hypothetical protein